MEAARCDRPVGGAVLNEEIFAKFVLCYKLMVLRTCETPNWVASAKNEAV